MKYQSIMMSPVLILDNEAAAWLRLQAVGGSSAMPLNIQNMIWDGTFHQAARNRDTSLAAHGLLDREAAAAQLVVQDLKMTVINHFTGAVTYLNSDNNQPSVTAYWDEPLVLLSTVPNTAAIMRVKQAANATGAFPDGFDWFGRLVTVSGTYPDTGGVTHYPTVVWP